MIDRRLVTDIGLALLIASPAVLPAAPSPGNADDQVGKTAPQQVHAFAGVSEVPGSYAAAEHRRAGS